MTERFMEAERKSSGSIWLPKCRSVWVSLLEPGKDGKYDLTVIVPKKAKLDALMARIKEVTDENVPVSKQKTTKLKSPIKKTEDNPRYADYAADYPLMISANSKVAPGLVGPDGKSKITESSEVYSGRWVVPSVNVGFYDFVDEKTGAKATGIKLYLNNVMLLDHDDAIGGFKRTAAEDEFGDAGVSTAEAMFG